MNTRREFLKKIASSSTALAVTASWSNLVWARDTLPSRPIPGTADDLPIVGLGNSNAFRRGDIPLSTALIELFHERGGEYIDCGGSSRFVVAEAANRLGIGRDLFLGTYFVEEDEVTVRDNVTRLLEVTSKDRLDLMHSLPEFAAPNWALFEKWKEEGLTQYIGVARHRAEYYDTMMELMETGTVDFLQVNYSPLETEAEKQILPMAMDKGVAVTINRPFINGEYFNHVRGHEVPEWAAEFDCDNWAAFSLKFILAHPAVTCVLTETADPDHARQNIAAGVGRLPDERMRRRMVAHLKGL